MKAPDKLNHCVSEDDATVDELMHALGRPSEQESALSTRGYTYDLIETVQDEDTEELLAPEMLFPEEIKLRA